MGTGHIECHVGFVASEVGRVLVHGVEVVPVQEVEKDKSPIARKKKKQGAFKKGTLLTDKMSTSPSLTKKCQHPNY
jgi:hypothetical protein